MSTPTDVTLEVPYDTGSDAPSTLSRTRPFYWSVRRELWEHRAVYIAPLAAAGVVMFGFLLGTIHLPYHFRMMESWPAAKQYSYLVAHYGLSAMAVVATSFIVSVVYCLGALHNERRDRSILFWKSLPVSDLTTVLAKACIVIVVLPAVTFAIVVVLQLIMFLWSTMVLLLSGTGTAILWTQLPLFRLQLILFYGLTVNALWFAPIYGWLLLVSCWAKRVVFLWAFLPPLALCIVERIAFDTSFLSHLLKYRLIGGFAEAFADSNNPMDQLPRLDPVRFLSSPGLWLGLMSAAALLAGAVWMRRNREPI